MRYDVAPAQARIDRGAGVGGTWVWDGGGSERQGQSEQAVSSMLMRCVRVVVVLLPRLFC